MRGSRLAINLKAMDILEIKFLADCPMAIPFLKSLFESEWEAYYGSGGLGGAEYDLISSSSRSGLPIALVALKSGVVCGTAALKLKSVAECPNLSPWLAALVVAPEFRKSGIGEKLIIEIENLAKILGYVEIFVALSEKSGLSEDRLLKNDWKIIFERDFFASNIMVFKKLL